MFRVEIKDEDGNVVFAADYPVVPNAEQIDVFFAFFTAAMTSDDD